MNTDLTKKSIAELRSLSIDINEAIVTQKAMISHIDMELVRRHGDSMKAMMTADGKTHGEISREIDGVKLTYSAKAKIKWDSEILSEIASTLPWATAKKVFKIEFSIPEKTFNALTDDRLIAQANAARTVEYTEPKVTFSK
jgi:hypothetical protein